ncbi:hypothetical protein [Tsukamurella pseudospumae]|uniref:hypothetical protein n=1 Tax=Tsukamurella pseudospumae TaxID=239498 RepID=UPI0012E75E79|nr:hypothetical protein [Tsukamurella pseudospumae]
MPSEGIASSPQGQKQIAEGVLYAVDHWAEVCALVDGANDIEEAAAILVNAYGWASFTAHQVLRLQVQDLSVRRRSAMKRMLNEADRKISDA